MINLKPSRIIVFLIKLYQKYVSPILPPSCRFYPTCSHYAVDAFSRHGAFKGGYLSIKRLAKCNPLHPGGIDPAPEEFNFFHKSIKRNG